MFAVAVAVVVVVVVVVVDDDDVAVVDFHVGVFAVLSSLVVVPAEVAGDEAGYREIAFDLVMNCFDLADLVLERCCRCFR